MNQCIGKFKFCRKEFTIIGASGIIQGDQGRSKGLKKYQAGIWQLRFCAIFEKQKMISGVLIDLWLIY